MQRFFLGPAQRGKPRNYPKSTTDNFMERGLTLIRHRLRSNSGCGTKWSSYERVIILNIQCLEDGKGASSYRIAGNFRGGANFRHCSNSDEIYTPRKFATVGKGRLIKLPRVCTRLLSKRII